MRRVIVDGLNSLDDRLAGPKDEIGSSRFDEELFELSREMLRGMDPHRSRRMTDGGKVASWPAMVDEEPFSSPKLAEARGTPESGTRLPASSEATPRNR